MAITQEVCNSFKLELLQAIHDFDNDTFKMALYTSSATLNKSTTVYSVTNEISGTGYVAGGQDLAVAATFPNLSGDEAGVDFDDEVWVASTFTTRGCLIYNSTKADRACWVLDFGSDVGPSSGNFTIIFPVLPVYGLT